MAIYHLHVKMISRSKGQSAVCSASYRRAAKLKDERLGRIYNYTNKKDVIFTQILLPEYSTSWLMEISKIQKVDSHQASEILWNHVERYEELLNSQPAREVEFSLPIELNQEQSIKLATRFIQNQFVAKGMIADMAVHWDEGNPHVHVMLTTRRLTETGFGIKERDWGKKSFVLECRQQWAEHVNHYLKLNHHDITVDHRSFKSRGIDLTATEHRGYQAKNKNIDHKDLEKNLFNKNEILKILQKHYAVFGEAEIKRILKTYSEDDALIQKAIDEIKQNPKVIYVGIGKDGKDKYTTRYMFELENKIQKYADKLSRRHKKDLSYHNPTNDLNNKLTEEQAYAVRYLTQGECLSSLIGRAGSGKSFVLGSARAIWEKNKYRTHGIALSGIAAANLQKESGISSRTIESFKHAIKSNQLVLNKKDIVIMDEAGMTNSESMLFILKTVENSNAKLVLVGDPEQLQPIGAGASFRAILERTGFAEINKVFRQQEEWQRQATMDLAAGKIREAIQAYDSRKHIHFSDRPFQAKLDVVIHWKKLREENVKKTEKNERTEKISKTAETELKDILIITYRNEDVKDLNQLIRYERLRSREITEIKAGLNIQTENGEINISEDDRILFTKNDYQLNIRNGYLGTVEKIESVSKIFIKLDRQENDQERIIELNPKTYNHFTHGYAATIHKTQGTTIKHSLVYASGYGWNKNLAYVALSRHKESCQLFVDKESFKNAEGLIKSFNRTELKDSVLDYPHYFAERRGIITESEKLISHLKNKLRCWANDLKQKFNSLYEKQDSQKNHQVLIDKSLQKANNLSPELKLKKSRSRNL